MRLVRTYNVEKGAPFIDGAGDGDTMGDGNTMGGDGDTMGGDGDTVNGDATGDAAGNYDDDGADGGHYGGHPSSARHSFGSAGGSSGPEVDRRQSVAAAASAGLAVVDHALSRGAAAAAAAAAALASPAAPAPTPSWHPPAPGPANVSGSGGGRARRWRVRQEDLGCVLAGARAVEWAAHVQAHMEDQRQQQLAGAPGAIVAELVGREVLVPNTWVILGESSPFWH
jgi:hypothetical protein